jgi:hypothetical protein
MYNEDKFMSDEMQSRTYGSLLRGLRAVLPGLPDEVRRRDVIAALLKTGDESVEVVIPPDSIYELSKASFGSLQFSPSPAANQDQETKLLLDRYPQLEATDLRQLHGTIHELTFELYQVVGMHGTGRRGI